MAPSSASKPAADDATISNGWMNKPVSIPLWLLVVLLGGGGFFGFAGAGGVGHLTREADLAGAEKEIADSVTAELGGMIASARADTLKEVETKMDAKFATIATAAMGDEKLQQQRWEEVSRRLDSIDKRLERLDAR